MTWIEDYFLSPISYQGTMPSISIHELPQGNGAYLAVPIFSPSNLELEPHP